ncbi:MAG: NUDIX domain-containing protein [Candidatus Babeliales bacterium]|nr:NUDIX domain-containing protein [Candidatus Babeliales bacterium]
MKYVLLFLLNSNNEILLLRRFNTDFGSGQYSLPGGKVEDKETAKLAIIRETFEEVGIHIKPENLEFVHLLFRNGTEGVFDVACFKANQWSGEVTNREPKKADEIKWFSKNALPENLLPAHKQIIEMITQKIYYSEHGF